MLKREEFTCKLCGSQKFTVSKQGYWWEQL